MIRGIDVSHYQGVVDWPRVKGRYGLDFAAAKCTEGTAFYDSEYARNLAGMRGAGLQGIVAYHYGRPTASASVRLRLAIPGLRKSAASSTGGIQASAIAQARYFVAKARPELLHAMVLDLEASPLNQAQTKLWRQTFLAEVRRLVAGTGVKVGLYLGGYAANETGRDAFEDADFWWFPRYATTSPATRWPTSSNPRVDTNTTGWKVPPAPHIWQWTPNLDGMDANVSNLTIAQLFNREDTLPTADEVAAALMATRLTNAVDGVSTARFDTFVTQTHKLATFSARDAAAALAILTGSDAAAQVAFFADLRAALGPGGSGPTAQEIADAVAVKFAQLLGGTA